MRHCELQVSGTATQGRKRTGPGFCIRAYPEKAFEPKPADGKYPIGCRDEIQSLVRDVCDQIAKVINEEHFASKLIPRLVRDRNLEAHPIVHQHSQVAWIDAEAEMPRDRGENISPVESGTDGLAPEARFRQLNHAVNVC